MMFTIVSDLVKAEHKAVAAGMLNACAGIAIIIGNSSSGESLQLFLCYCITNIYIYIYINYN